MDKCTTETKSLAFHSLSLFWTKNLDTNRIEYVLKYDFQQRDELDLKS